MIRADIRRAEVEDLACLTFVEDAEQLVIDGAEFTRICTEENAVAFVAEWNGTLLGNVVAQNSENNGHRFTCLMLLFIAPTFRGHGLGTALMRAVERYARESGSQAVLLHVRNDNPRARALYERCGYTQYDTDADGAWLSVCVARASDDSQRSENRGVQPPSTFDSKQFRANRPPFCRLEHDDPQAA